MSSSSTSIRTVRRVIAVALTIIFAMTFTTPSAFAGDDIGGDFGACEDGLWLKADWNGEGWTWDAGDGWTSENPAPTHPNLTLDEDDTDEDGDPLEVSWTSDTYVDAVTVKASTKFEAFAGGYSGTVTAIDKTGGDGQHAISNIVFCYLDLGSLTVHKVVEGEPDGQPVFGIEFVIDSTSEVHDMRVGEYLAYYDLHEGTSWSIKEVTTGGADSVSYAIDGVPATPDGNGYITGTIAEGQDVLVTVTNTYEPPPTGSLTVEKVVVGDHDGEDDFDFAGTCELPQFPAHAAFSLADGESWTFPEEIPGYLNGSPCTFEETDDNDADSVTYTLGETELTPDPDGKVTFNLSSTEDLVLTVTNTFEPERPEVVLEKAWFADADDDVPVALFRKIEGEWTQIGDDPEYSPPNGFDATVTYGEETYTVAETLPSGWQNITCPADAPEPNGLEEFPYEKPDDGQFDVAAKRVAPDMLRHIICNAPLPTPPPPTPTPTPEPDVPDIGLTKVPDVDTVLYDPDDGDDETVTYTYTITNTGETTLDDITLVDDVLGTITLTDTDLDVDESMTITAVHTVTAADADVGQIVNTAVTTGTAPDDTEVTDTADATVLVEEVAPLTVLKPEISLEKSADVTPDEDGNKVVIWNAATPDGTTITYEYVITNTGETTLTDITLVDDVLGTITLTDTDLAVGESMTVTAVHTVAEADAVAGSVTNLAATTGTDPEGTQVTDTAEETVLVGEVQAEVIEQQPAVVEDDKLPATGAAVMFLALLATFSLVTGTSLLRTSRRRT